MIYSTPEFLILLAIALPLFLLLNGYRARFSILLASSLFFYAWAGMFDTAIFLFVVLLSWSAPRLALSFPRARKPLIGFGIFVLAGHLLFWKYMPWLVRVGQEVHPALHGGTPLFLPLPVGISFFTLQGIAYLVDFYKHEAEFIPLGEYVLFKSFFPQLVAGPIVRVPQLLPQLRRLPTPTAEDLRDGAVLFCVGFFKKVALADRLAPMIDDVFLRLRSFDRISLIQALLGYTVQIWADFSGYSDMGIGVARMFGIRLPVNFLSPYLSRSPSEFWRRWHITLSQWIRDYIYIPLGGNRGSAGRALGVAMLTMAISGLWHGANWTFVAWGLYHGVLLAVERRGVFGARKLGEKESRSTAVWGWMLMMTATLFGWLLFRAQNFTAVGVFLRGVFGPGVHGATESISGMRAPLALGLAACAAAQLWEYVDLKTGRRIVKEAVASRVPSFGVMGPVVLGVALAALVLGALFLRSDSPTQAFIYFQF
jgi:alginate O-acetyltransferase complex protein AlgI